MLRRKHRQVEGPVSRTGQDQGRKAGSPLCAVWAPGASEGRGELSRQIGQRALVTVDGEQRAPVAGGPRAERWEGGRPRGASSACLLSALSDVGSDLILVGTGYGTCWDALTGSQQERRGLEQSGSREGEDRRLVLFSLLKCD